jgi:hypothetical protein
MKKEHKMQFPIGHPIPVTRSRVALLLKAARSRKGKRNVWVTSDGYYIWDVQATITANRH